MRRKSLLRFNKHWQAEGKHAFLGASKHHWINYDLEKMRRIWANQFASEIGTRKHAWAAEAIRLKLRMPRNNKTLNAYINDAIGFNMEPEVVLYVNDDCFGTADAISFNKRTLRIHDLKTGVHPGSFNQLLIYCAFFCIEYRINPFEIEMILRLYQNDEVEEMVGDPNEVNRIIQQIKLFIPEIESMREVMA